MLPSAILPYQSKCVFKIRTAMVDSSLFSEYSILDQMRRKFRPNWTQQPIMTSSKPFEEICVLKVKKKPRQKKSTVKHAMTRTNKDHLQAHGPSYLMSEVVIKLILLPMYGTPVDIALQDKAARNVANSNSISRV